MLVFYQSDPIDAVWERESNYARFVFPFRERGENIAVASWLAKSALRRFTYNPRVSVVTFSGLQLPVTKPSVTLPKGEQYDSDTETCFTEITAGLKFDVPRLGPGDHVAATDQLESELQTRVTEQLQRCERKIRECYTFPTPLILNR